jgi:hypothetical protein
VVNTSVSALSAGRRRSAYRARVPLLVADRHQDRVHAVHRAARDELAEDRGHPGVAGGATDVVLARIPVGRVHDELVGRLVEGGGGGQRLNVAAVAGLGHGEAAGQREGGDVVHVGRVVALRAEVQDGTAEQPPLHPGLHQQRQVAVGQHLERHDRPADVPVTAVLSGDPAPPVTERREGLHAVGDQRALRRTTGRRACGRAPRRGRGRRRGRVGSGAHPCRSPR